MCGRASEGMPRRQRQQTGVKPGRQNGWGSEWVMKEQRLEGLERYQRETAQEPRWIRDLHSEGSVQSAVDGLISSWFLLWQSVPDLCGGLTVSLFLHSPLPSVEPTEESWEAQPRQVLRPILSPSVHPTPPGALSWKSTDFILGLSPSVSSAPLPGLLP